MNHPSRRSFIQGFSPAGLALAGPMASFLTAAPPSALAAVDLPVALVLAAYGKAWNVQMQGQTALIQVDVSGLQALTESFAQFAALSDRVLVKDGRISFAYGDTSYTIQNRH